MFKNSFNRATCWILFRCNIKPFIEPPIGVPLLLDFNQPRQIPSKCIIDGRIWQRDVCICRLFHDFLTTLQSNLRVNLTCPLYEILDPICNPCVVFRSIPSQHHGTIKPMTTVCIGCSVRGNLTCLSSWISFVEKRTGDIVFPESCKVWRKFLQAVF